MQSAEQLLEEEQKNLIRKIDDTRRSRFQMASRLRAENAWRQTMLLVYNIAIIVLSIITLYSYFSERSPFSSHILLAFSISLSLYSTHLSGSKRLETAGMMEQNANALSTLLTEANFLKLHKNQLTASNLENITKKYESTINNVQNHDKLDYYYVKVKSLKTKLGCYRNQESTSDLEEKIKFLQETIDEMDKELEQYQKNEIVFRVLGYSIVFICSVITLTTPFFI